MSELVSESSARPYETISLSRKGLVARITLDRPDKLNALDPTMLDELIDALAGLAADDDVNALVLTGRGRLFSAGVDLSTPFFMEDLDDAQRATVFSGKRLLDWQHRVITGLYELPFPTVAAVNGDAVGGGGFGLAMACDLRIAVRGARFWMVPGTLAVVQDFGLSWLVQRAIGPSRTLQMAVLGKPVPAEVGEGWGLVNEVVDDTNALGKRIDELTTQFDSMGTDALRMLKLVVRNGATSPLREQLAMEAVSNGLTFQSTEFADRKAAYLGSLRKKGS
jgi:enoyl-CoA hydratase/carnithine racemase